MATNAIPNSPITLAVDRAAWRSIPEVSIAVQDGFGPNAVAVLHRGRWWGLIPRNGYRVARLDGRVAKPSALTTRVNFGQSLEGDEQGRVLVVGGSGESLYRVDDSGAATCLGVLPAGSKIEAACWLADGGVALMLGEEICVYRPDGDARLRPLARFAVGRREIWSLRSLAHAHASVHVLAAMADRFGVLYAIGDSGEVRVLADWGDLDMADVRLFLDETGRRWMLPEGSTITTGGSPTRVDGIDEALARREGFPRVEPASTPAPELAEGAHLPAPAAAEAELEVAIEPPPDALVAPSLDRLGALTRALIRMLRAAPVRSSPDPAILQLIRTGMPHDLRAYVHAWAVHAPSHPTVYEFWMAPPTPVNRGFMLEQVGDSIQLGTFASGEPIVARRVGVGSCEVVMFDDEGVPYRYSGIEGFLLDLQMRAPDDRPFELNEWMD